MLVNRVRSLSIDESNFHVGSAKDFGGALKYKSFGVGRYFTITLME
jgi:hypothetical protein